MLLPTLYSRTSSGAVQTWTMEIVKNQYRTVYGLTDGKRTLTEWSTAEATNVGRANERSADEQAEFEARSFWKKQTEFGKFEDIKKIDNLLVSLDVMLALEFDKFMDNIKYVDFSTGLGVQNKYNGCRCTAQLIKGKVALYSRGLKEWFSCPHINKSLEGFFKKYPNAKLDGELYNYDLRQKLNELNSLIRKKNPNAAHLAKTEELVRYYIYDGFDFNEKLDQSAPYADRKAFIDTELPKFSEYYRKVETWIVYSQAELEKLYEKFIARGDEGAIIRIMTAGYDVGRRSYFLFKYKPEYDAEGVVESIEDGDGNWKGAAKGCWITWKGKKFKATFKGSRPVCTKIFKDRAKWVGREVTFYYMDLTGKGVPASARIDPNNCTKADR